LLHQKLGRNISCDEFLQKYPITSIKLLSQNLKISVPSVTKGLNELNRLGIIKERTGYTRNRLFEYQDYIRLLSEGTRPL
jgi:Mn-dependent DtxR family transcriptional regulator